MAADRRLRVALAGDGEAAVALRRRADGSECVRPFEVSWPDATSREPLDVAVLVHDGRVGAARGSSRQLREHTAAPVVLATTARRAELVRWALDAGIADVLSLPGDAGGVLFAIEKAAHAARQADVPSG